MENLYEKIVKKLIKENISISFMESCTGGFLANQITNIENSSKIFKVGIVSYSNEYKIKFNVPKEIINQYTVYSIETANEMAKAISDLANSEIGVGITGELAENSSNKVYYSIYVKITDDYIAKEITAIGNSRNEKKEYVAEEVFKEILKIVIKRK